MFVAQVTTLVFDKVESSRSVIITERGCYIYGAGVTYTKRDGGQAGD